MCDWGVEGGVGVGVGGVGADPRVATVPRDLPLKTERNSGNESCPRLVTVHQSVIQAGLTRKQPSLQQTPLFFRCDS